ncbi:MAG: FAD-dependent oxidoreductase [Acidimicrobiales bacterium]|nr:FAD-dependent oxidoreductase [Acidimicrobiales bacterium]
MSEVESVVIVGTGAAGYAVAEGLQLNGFTGNVTLVGEEQGDPYDRPPLTKEILAGKWEPERATLLAAKRVAPLNPTVLSGVRAEGVDVAKQQLTLTGGQVLDYDALVVATGVYPRTLPHPESSNIHVIRTMDQSLALRAQLGDGVRFVVVGGGFLGLEAAATARGLGALVSVVEPVPGPPLANRIGDTASAMLLALHTDHDVRVQTGIGVDAIETGEDNAVTLKLSDASRLDADVVLISIGASPTVAWLEDSGLPLDNGLVCDEFCHAGSGVWGAGDVASWMHLGYNRRLRLEHRTNAQEQGQHVAANILGAHRAFTPVPYFWTDHYDARIQVGGIIPSDATAEIVEGNPDDGSFVQTFSAEGRMLGVLGWNAARAAAQYRRQLSAE